jgi:RHS repeat-associated protein
MRRQSTTGLILGIVLAMLSAAVEAQTTITSISPSVAPTGTSVTIMGTGFGTSQGLSNTVTFAGAPVSPRIVATSWTAQKIVVTVPSSAISGNVVVTVAGHASNAIFLTVTPTVANVTPASALAGNQVTLSGSGFGNTQAVGASTITFNGVAATPSTWSSTSIVVVVPNNATAGPAVVTVAGQPSNGTSNFTPTPSVSSVAPGFGASGSAVTISGNSFGAAQSSSVVTLNGISAATSNWSNTTIGVTVPNAASTGPVVVSVNGVPSNGASFTVTPGITGISPNPGMAGSTVTISGTTFGSSQGSSAVTFNGVVAATKSWSNSSIVALVPDNVSAGPVVVTVNGFASNGLAFSLPPPYSYSVSYAPNGAVTAVTDSVNGTWSYTYDDFNRLSTANRTDSPLGLGFAYDRYGNRWQQNVTAGTAGSSQLVFNGSNQATRVGICYHAAGLNNQPDGYCFDAAGNLLNDGLHSYTYDGENRLIAVDNGQSATYLYNPAGQRISKTTPSGTSEFLYDSAGRMVTEVSGSGAWTRGEIYAGRKHVGTYRDGITYFAQTDWLGTERVRVLPTGNLFQTCIGLPFGDGMNCSGASDPSVNHFTGKPRDVESGLDYFGARYYSSAMGRFTSPDAPLADQRAFDPQSWNLYRYASNSPLANVDFDGHVSLAWERVKAVRIAWREEQALVEKTGKGSRNWTEAELAELKTTGRVKGYYGHHINSVSGSPSLAGDPDNIKFVTRDEHFSAHSGNWRTQTFGELKSRTKALASLNKLNDAATALMVLQTITGGVADYMETKATGIRKNLNGMLNDIIPQPQQECFCFIIDDPAKAAVTLDGERIRVDGTGFVNVDGGKYRDSFGHEISPDDLKNKEFRFTYPGEHENIARNGEEPEGEENDRSLVSSIEVRAGQ